MRKRAAAVGLAALGLVALVRGEEPGKAPAAPVPSPHQDGPAAERAVVDATVAFLHEDLQAARAALDRIEAGCRRLNEDDVVPAGREVVNYDRAFHAALSMSREMAAAQDLERSWEQFMWVTKGCRTCHALSRGEGPTKPKATTR